MKKFPITWRPIEGLPGCYEHDHQDHLPADHAVMIQQVDEGKWRVFYSIPYTEFLKAKKLGVASEGKVTLSMNPFQFTVTHDLGCFNRCKIAGRFYIEKYIEGEMDVREHDKEVEPVKPTGKEQIKRYSL